MRNETQTGKACSVVAPAGGFVSGNGYLVGKSLFGIAGFSCAAGATGVLWLEGQYTLAKTSAQAWAVGDPIFWNTSTNLCDNLPSTGPKIGLCVATAANPSATREVRLDGTGAGAIVDAVSGVGASYKMARGVYTSAAP